MGYNEHRYIYAIKKVRDLRPAPYLWAPSSNISTLTRSVSGAFSRLRFGPGGTRATRPPMLEQMREAMAQAGMMGN
jgi:hypothetical protein